MVITFFSSSLLEALVLRYCKVCQTLITAVHKYTQIHLRSVEMSSLIGFVRRVYRVRAFYSGEGNGIDVPSLEL